LPIEAPLESKPNGKVKTEEIFPVPKGTKEKQSQTRERAGNPILPGQKSEPMKGAAARRTPCPAASPLKDEVKAKFKGYGAPDALFDALRGYTMMVDILNGDTAGGCSNPISAYAKFARDNPKLPFAKLWMPVANGRETRTDDDYDGISAVDTEAIRRMYANRTDAERDSDRAGYWWAELTIEQRDESGVECKWSKDGIGTYNEKQIIAAWKSHQAENGATA